MKTLWFTILCSCFAITIYGQDSLQRRAKLAPSLYFDYGKALAAFTEEETKIEGGLEVLFMDKWQAIAEYGTAQLEPRAAVENGSYLSEGSYFRLGVGFIPEVDKGTRLGIGLRYARAFFEDQGDYALVSPSGVQEDVFIPFARENLTAQWWEAVFYTDRSLTDWLDIGMLFRLRFMNTRDETDDVVGIYSIPGYGRAEDKSIPALNLFIKISPF
jgi:hypothetical protein